MSLIEVHWPEEVTVRRKNIALNLQVSPGEASIGLAIQQAHHDKKFSMTFVRGSGRIFVKDTPNLDASIYNGPLAIITI